MFFQRMTLKISTGEKRSCEEQQWGRRLLPCKRRQIRGGLKEIRTWFHGKWHQNQKYSWSAQRGYSSQISVWEQITAVKAFTPFYASCLLLCLCYFIYPVLHPVSPSSLARLRSFHVFFFKFKSRIDTFFSQLDVQTASLKAKCQEWYLGCTG